MTTLFCCSGRPFYGDAYPCTTDWPPEEVHLTTRVAMIIFVYIAVAIDLHVVEVMMVIELHVALAVVVVVELYMAI